jgi:hypothetical protein
MRLSLPISPFALTSIPGCKRAVSLSPFAARVCPLIDVNRNGNLATNRSKAHL